MEIQFHYIKEAKVSLQNEIMILLYYLGIMKNCPTEPCFLCAIGGEKIHNEI